MRLIFGLRQPAAAINPEACCGDRVRCERALENEFTIMLHPTQASRLAQEKRQQAAAVQVFP